MKTGHGEKVAKATKRSATNRARNERRKNKRPKRTSVSLPNLSINRGKKRCHSKAQTVAEVAEDISRDGSYDEADSEDEEKSEDSEDGEKTEDEEIV